jgi:uncharacterized radical SAM superfamily Fe-S cluster-containing enzyme
MTPNSLTRGLESVATGAASLVWQGLRLAVDRVPNQGFQPPWAPAPLQKSPEMNRPELGWPRKTDSLCPRCVQEGRAAILEGRKHWTTLLEETPGEIEATITERDGQVWMDKECPKHGAFHDLMAVDSAFLRRIESLHPGGDFTTPATPLRNHGKSTIKYGRGSVLTIDLTNRCNMMCDACFMDANQVGYVHELTFADVQKILDDAISVKPKRQMSINFSGGEPTISPIFLDSVRYARKVGYFAVQCSTNGVRFAQDPDFAFKAKEAGLRTAYLQFDGVGNPAHAHRKVSNLFDVKQRAIDNLKAAGIGIVLVPTIINTVNDDQVGDIIRFAIANADKVTVISFQPVSFTGRDEDIDEETRVRQRYTLSHLARDVAGQTGMTDPLKDWFPLSAMGPFADVVDVMLGSEAEWGSLKCGCHPNCGVGTALFVNKRTGETMPLSNLIDMEQLLADMRAVADGCHGKALTVGQIAVALLRNYRPESSPIPFHEVLRQFLSQTGAVDFGGEDDSETFDWRILFVAGMWFQDLFNYDFRRTERCIIPYGTQMGEISFCAYNTGVGWRQILENIHQVATVKEWYATVGRHPIHAGDRPVELPDLPALRTGGGGCGSGCGDGGCASKVGGEPPATPMPAAEQKSAKPSAGREQPPMGAAAG